MVANEDVEKVGQPFSPPQAMPQLQSISIERIDHSPYQVRQTFDEGSLRELANSIQQVGLVQPIAVRPVADRFQVVAGERRLRAAQLLGWTSIPALIEPLSDLDAAVRTLVENEQRQEVNPVERARGYKRLSESPFNLTQEEISKRVGVSRSGVARVLELLDQPPAILDFVTRGTISPGHVRPLNTIEDESERIELATQAANKQWSVRETEKHALQVAKRGTSGKSHPAEKSHPEKSQSGWQIFLRVLQALRGIALLQRIVKWIFAFAVRLIPSGEDRRRLLPKDVDPPQSGSSKAA